MTRLFHGGLLLVILISFGLHLQAKGAVIAFSNEALFLSSLPESPLSESFESLAVNNSEFSMSSVLLGDFNLVSGVTFGVFNLPEYFGTYATDGSRYLVTTYNGSSEWRMHFQFTTALSAFALDVTDFGDNGFSTLKMEVGTHVFDIAAAPRPNGNLLFFGIQGVAETFSEVTLVVKGDPIGLDRIQFLAVPEPSRTILLAIGMLASYRRRRTIAVGNAFRRVQEGL